jgi:ABC-type antimicrobial peptide transport system permease subunit
MGVRLALGANPSSVVWLVMREVLTLLGLGLLIGIPASVALGRFVASQLYGIQADDPVIAGVTIAILVTVASLAGLVPAMRASRIDPILALRYE